MNSNETGKEWAHNQLSESQRSFILNDAVYYEIAHALAVPPHDRSNLALWETVNFSRMGHARGLLDYFEHSRNDKKPPKSDDVLSEDFGYAAKKILLPEPDRLRFNKDLFHPTYSRCRHLEPGAVKEWPLAILGPIHERCLAFVDFVLSGGILHGVNVRRDRWQEMSDALRSGHEMILTYGPDFTDLHRWRVCAGPTRLEGGLSRLTTLQGSVPPSEWRSNVATS